MSFLSDLWSGKAAPDVVFCRDMLFVGSALNMASLVLVLLSAALRWPWPVTVLLYAAPLPWNAVLLIGIWQGSKAMEHDAQRIVLRAAAALWFAVFAVL